MRPDILARAYASLDAAQPPKRRHHTQPERTPVSRPWSADNRTPIEVNRFAGGGFVDRLPDATAPTLLPAAPASKAAAGYSPGMFDDLITQYATPEPDDVVTSAAPQIVEFEGQRHEFPNDFTDQDISSALASIAAPKSGGMFDDLIAEAEAKRGTPPTTLAETSAAAPATDAPPQTWAQYAEGMAQKAAQGVTLGFADELAAGIGSLVGKRSYDEILGEVRGREKAFETAQPMTALGAEIAGSLGTGIGSGATAARLLARAPGWLGRPGLARSALGAGATAAPLGAVSEVGRLEGRDKTIGDYTDAALEGGQTAALFGTGIGAAGHGLARVVGPWASAQAQRLADRGIRLTPGQLMGPNAKRLEDTVTSLPLVNMIVRARRNDAIEDLNRVAIDDALAPIGRTLPRNIEMGHDAVAHAGDEISAAYRRAVPRMEGERNNDLQNQLFRLSTRLPPEQEQTFANYVSRELDNVTGGVTPFDPVTQSYIPTRISGDDMQHLISDFRTEGNRLTANVNASHHDRELGRAFTHAADELETNLTTHSPQDAVDEFLAANRAFANMVRVEKAAGMSDEGIFTPAQFKNAVRTSDRSSRKRAVARGEALMQGLGSDAKVVIGNMLNDSGTPERAITSGAILGGGAFTLNPSLLTAPLALAPFYSRAATRAFQAAAAGRAGPRQRAREYLERMTRAGAPAAAIGADTAYRE